MHFSTGTLKRNIAINLIYLYICTLLPIAVSSALGQEQGWKRLEDSKLRFHIDYPEDWEISKCDISKSHYYYKIKAPFRGPSSAPEIKRIASSISIDCETDTMPAAKWAEVMTSSHAASGSDAKIEGPIRVVKYGVSGIRVVTKYSGGCFDESFLFDRNGWVIVVTVYAFDANEEDRALARSVFEGFKGTLPDRKGGKVNRMAKMYLDQSKYALERKDIDESKRLAELVIERYPDSNEAMEAKAILEGEK